MLNTYGRKDRREKIGSVDLSIFKMPLWCEYFELFQSFLVHKGPSKNHVTGGRGGVGRFLDFGHGRSRGGEQICLRKNVVGKIACQIT